MKNNHNNFLEGYFGKLKSELDTLTVSFYKRPLYTREFFEQSKLYTAQYKQNDVGL